MEYRSYKNTDDEISLLGFGAMRLPKNGPEDSDIDHDTAQKMIDLAYAQGVNYYDTAYGYHGGQSERFLGKALAKYPRDSYYLTSKLPMWLVETDADVERILNEQLEKCQTDHFDFYLTHALSDERLPTLEKCHVLETLQKMKQAGKIRHIGFSFHDTPEVLEKVCGLFDWELGQLQLNYFDWDFLRAGEMYGILERHGIPCVVMEPVRGGRLADLGEPANAELEKAAPRRSIASWAMRFAGGLPNVMTVLSGMSTEDQVRDNLATFTPFAPLSGEEKAALDRVIPIFKAHAAVPCTACRYCMPCPSGVDIPGVFEAYNNHAYSGNSVAEFRRSYAEFPAESNAAHCVACGQCEAVCPQQIGIIGWMEKINEITAGA